MAGGSKETVENLQTQCGTLQRQLLLGGGHTLEEAVLVGLTIEMLPEHQPRTHHVARRHHIMYHILRHQRTAQQKWSNQCGGGSGKCSGTQLSMGKTGGESVASAMFNICL